MGYACPVCEDPQADAGHLANHLAFTAMLRDDAHGAWLDEHAPGWEAMGESELADVLLEAVEETEYPQVFEDTAGGLSEPNEPPAERSGALFDESREADHDHERAGHGHGRHAAHAGPGVPDVAEIDHGGPADEETEAILEEAREMTRAMLGFDEDAPEADSSGDETAAVDGDDRPEDPDDGADADPVGTDPDDCADGNENE